MQIHEHTIQKILKIVNLCLEWFDSFRQMNTSKRSKFVNVRSARWAASRTGSGTRPAHSRTQSLYSLCSNRTGLRARMDLWVKFRQRVLWNCLEPYSYSCRPPALRSSRKLESTQKMELMKSLTEATDGSNSNIWEWRVAARTRSSCFNSRLPVRTRIRVRVAVDCSTKNSRDNAMRVIMAIVFP